MLNPFTVNKRYAYNTQLNLKIFKTAMLLIATLLFNYSLGQTSKLATHKNLKRLSPGEKIQLNKYEFHSTRNYKKRIIKLSDFQSKKLIILDFWSKYCTYCISEMPRLQELQEKFNNDIQIILVTRNKIEELNYLFQKSTILRETNLPMIMSDSVLYSYLFPHNSEPYHVWIDNTGKVLSMTQSDQTTEANIKEYLINKSVKFKNRIDNINNGIPQDILDSKISLLNSNKFIPSRNLMYLNNIVQNDTENNYKTPINGLDIRSNHGFNSDQSYSLILNHDGIQPSLAGTGKRIYLQGSLKDTIGIKLFQYSLQSLIVYAYKDLFDRIYIEYPEYSKLTNKSTYFEPLTDSTNSLRYESENTYSYEICIPVFTDEKARNILKLDIERFFGVKLRIDTLSVKYSILKAENKHLVSEITESYSPEAPHEKIRRDNTMRFINYPLANIANDFNFHYSNQNVRFSIDNDESLKNKCITMTVNNWNWDLKEENVNKLNRELKEFGIKIETKILNPKTIIIENAY